jgi:aryl-alcohol dehydrogenase-like predicted oxidoreductase
LVHHWTVTPEDQAAIKVLDKIAKELNTSITSVALMYIALKAPYVFPIVGVRRIDHLTGSI